MTSIRVAPSSSHGVGHTLRGVASALALLALAACEAPGQDKVRSEGGTAPDPTAVITGAVAYLGPRPHCEYSGGKAKRVIGRVVMTLFEYNNPAPPEGRATSALNLLYVNGDKLFTLDDCLPEGEDPDPTERITRSVPYRWTGIELKQCDAATGVCNYDKAMAYQVRGFYDADEDMNPFFRVKNLPTAGDVGGGAVRDFLAPEKGFLPIEIPSFNQAKDGFERPNVTVGLNTFVYTERPVFKLSKNRFLNAEWQVPVVADLAGGLPIKPKTPETLRATWELTCANEADPGCDDGFALEHLDEKTEGPKLAANDVQLDFDDTKYAFYAEPVDVKTIVKGGPDVILPDGKPDPHPILGSSTSLNIHWYQPMVIIQRTPFVLGYDPASAESVAQLANVRAVEAAAKIPSVSMVGTVLIDEGEVKTDLVLPDSQASTVLGEKRTFVDKMNIAVPPVGVVTLDPTNPFCAIPYLAFGSNEEALQRTSAQSYESRTTVCQDLPTGLFGVNVLAGVAGGALTEEPDPDVSENGFVSNGARYASQAWSLPNELGDPAQTVADGVITSQGWSNLFVVHDPHPDDKDNCDEAVDPSMGVNPRPIVFRGICKANENPFLEDANGTDTVGCLPQGCCDAVSHLCGVPLCEVVEIEGRKVRSSPTSVEENEDGRKVPNCIPFSMPSLCCPEG